MPCSGWPPTDSTHGVAAALRSSITMRSITSCAGVAVRVSLRRSRAEQFRRSLIIESSWILTTRSSAR
jgi:hypothetical protein